jgi:pimeloyl-ACP methyl ester carboxylesterase
VRHAVAQNAAGKDPAVFVHGLGGGSASWTDLMTLLSDRLDCYAPDLPGFGQSPPPLTDRYGVPDQACAVSELMRRLGGRAHLIGNSLGGAVAVQAAAWHPESVSTLTLVSPALPDWRPRPALLMLPLPLIPRIGELVMRRAAADTPQQQARQMVQGLAGDAALIPQLRIDEAAAEIAAMDEHQHAERAYLGALGGAVRAYVRRGRNGLWQAARQISAPTLAVYGGADPLIGTSLAGRTGRTIRRSRIVILPRAGHIAQLEAPRVLADAITTLLTVPPPQ